MPAARPQAIEANMWQVAFTFALWRLVLAAALCDGACFSTAAPRTHFRLCCILTLNRRLLAGMRETFAAASLL